MHLQSPASVCAALLAGLLSTGPSAFGQPNRPPLPKDRVILDAMRQELERSKLLRIPSLSAPYFIEYALDDSEAFGVGAILGATVSQSRNWFRIPRVQVRVGSAQFDDTNYMYTGLFGGANLADSFPLDDNSQAIRTWFWLATDHAYKGAIESLSRKRAALKNVTVTEQINDFASVEPVKKIWEGGRSAIDDGQWTERVRRLSALFSGYPEVYASSVEFNASQTISYLANTEGTEIRYPDHIGYIRIRAGSQAADGMAVRDATVIHSLDLSKLPPEAELARQVQQVAANVTALVSAPLGESYTGPVLFEGVAAAQLFADVFGNNLGPMRRPVSEPGRTLPIPASELEGRVGSRIVPEFLDVVDDPTQTEWQGQRLIGHYAVDMEGVTPKPLTLVEKGVLKTLLLTRQPVRGHEGSNGRARLPGPFGHRRALFGNLFVKATESVSAADLKKQLLDLVNRRGKTFGLIVRKLDFPTTATPDELRRMMAASSSSGSSRNVSAPLLVYRVDLEGKEELIRGLRFRSLSVRSFRDITAASNDSHIFEFLASTFGSGAFVAPSAVVAPSLLFEEIELERRQEEQPTLPLVEPPPLKPSAR